MPPAVTTDVDIKPPAMIGGGSGGDGGGGSSSSSSSSSIGSIGTDSTGSTRRVSAAVDGTTKRLVSMKEAVTSTRGKARTAQDKQSIEYVVRSGVAGGLAGCAAKTLVGPLDRVKILFQASSPQFAKYSGSWMGMVTALREINRSEGWAGLFRGHSATLVRVFPYAAIKFLAYEQFRAAIIPSKEYETPLRRLASGSLAGLTGTFFTYPLEIIRVRLAFETKKDSKSSFVRICKQIYHEQPSRPGAGAGEATRVGIQASGGSGSAAANVTTATVHAASQTIEAVTPKSGLANFFRGFTPTLLGILPYAGVSFLTHDYMGDLLRHPSITKWTAASPPRGGEQPLLDSSGRPRLTHTAELVSGAVASVVGQTSAYPLEIIRRRMQVGAAVGDGHRLRISETAAKIWAQQGWRGFFVGLSIGYIKVVPMGAVGFWTYEIFKQWLGA